MLEQLDKSSLYVPGDPGSGKSTFCRWVAWLVAAGAMPEAEVAAEEDYVEPFPQALAERLPLLIRLRDVWRFLPRDAGRDTLSCAELESAPLLPIPHQTPEAHGQQDSGSYLRLRL